MESPHTYILAQKQTSRPHPFRPSSCLLPSSLLSFPSLSPESLAYHRSSQGSCAPQENPQSRMSRARGLVRAARCWAHVLRGESCEGASEGWGEACEVRKGLRGQESRWTTTLPRRLSKRKRQLEKHPFLCLSPVSTRSGGECRVYTRGLASPPSDGALRQQG